MTWTGEERRTAEQLIDGKNYNELTIADLAKLIRHLSKDVRELKSQSDEHSRTEIEFRDSVYKAFPERDFQDHHDFHYEKRELKKQNQEILLEGKKKVFGGLIWGAILLIGYGAIEWIKKQLNS